MSDDGASLGDLSLARDLGLPHAGADGRHADEPSPFHDGDLVGVLGPVCVAARTRPDAGEAGRSAIGKAVADGADGPVEVTRTGLVGDAHGDRVRHGGRLSEALAVADSLPPMAVRMLRLGEETGQLPVLAGRVAEFYEAKLQRSLDRVVGIVGPLAIITISTVVGGLIVSVMTALLSVTQLVG